MVLGCPSLVARRSLLRSVVRAVGAAAAVTADPIIRVVIGITTQRRVLDLCLPAPGAQNAVPIRVRLLEQVRFGDRGSYGSDELATWPRSISTALIAAGAAVQA